MTWAEVLKPNLWQFLVWIDQGLGGLVSTILKEKAFADLTLSANAFRWERAGIRKWPRVIIDKIFFFEECHCYDSWLNELKRSHVPPDTRFCPCSKDVDV